ncbi:unnamed protein product [Paramecium sonneborni]|uniref:Uncharacterized protein n=1 Tax=Paramecium sonneborni TaxID=65129 RepID=A0A8S1MYC2_9CILI|nr:unnamed protein product [Paramecium sonneborni]
MKHCYLLQILKKKKEQVLKIKHFFNLINSQQRQIRTNIQMRKYYKGIFQVLQSIEM